ncbi:MAG: hypothetical protein M3Z56_04210 [Bacteroidota bacterium]|nr:hypothetical protein [Bacteroidota bacterium]
MLFKMINRDNYEEYFLLYADNELTDNEKIEVLKFIRENKDLEDEFKMIQHTVCKPEINTILDDKSFLFKESEDSFITEKNYEDIFVLYHDNELTSDEKHRTELFLNIHPKFKNDFDLVASAKLIPDNSITFPKKQKLYRNEKAGRVVSLVFWRMLAVAMFIGFGLWILGTYYQQKKELPVVVKNSTTVPKNSTRSLKEASEKKSSEKILPKENKPGENPIAEVTNIAGKKQMNQQIKPEKKVSPSLVKTSVKNKIIEVLQLKKPVEKNEPDVAISVSKINDIPELKAIENNDVSPPTEINVKATKNNNATTSDEIQAQPASYAMGPNDKNENYVFYNITTEEFKKSKVGGFLKKVKRIVERNNPITRLLSGDDKQVVSN